MKNYYFFLTIFIYTTNISAQNVGIGTTSPTSKLEIKNPVKSTVKISSNNFSDTSQLILSNRNTGNLGTDMQITSIRETGLRVSSSSDLTENNKDTIMQITPTGNVGIRTATPQYPLDVKGDMNVTGELRTNGSGGEAGDVLRSNGNGTMSWGSKEKFDNFRVYRNNGTASSQTYTFTIPAGVTKVGIEMWGGGGRASSSEGGGSGGYIYAIIPAFISSTINISVGAGGGCSTCPTTGAISTISNGVSSLVNIGSASLVLLTAGEGSVPYSFIPPSNSQGGFSASGTSLNSISYFGIEGGAGQYRQIDYQNTGSGFLLYRINGAGGDSPTRPSTGGKSGVSTTDIATGSTSLAGGTNGSEPGGGGGFPTGKGGNGQVILYW